MRRALLFFVATFLPGQSAPAGPVAAPNFNTWFQYFGDHALGPNWSLRAESHIRRSDSILTWQQLMARGGPSYRINDRFSVATAYHYLYSYRFGAQPATFTQDEHRLGHDFAWRESIGRTAFAQRFRYENRWISLMAAPSPGRRIGWFYENRLRYQTRLTRPLGRHYGTVYQETFMPVPPESHPRRVDQFRLGFAVGREFSPVWRAEIGYMYQAFWQRNGRARDDNHTLLLTFFHNGTIRR